MNRRQFLTTIPALVGMSGCLGTADTPITPSRMHVTPQHWVGDIVQETDITPSGNRPRSYQIILTYQSTATHRLQPTRSVQQFVKATEFDESYLVIVVAASWPSGYWLELVEIERLPNGLRFHIYTNSPDEPVGDDAAVHSHATRITDTERRIPNQIEIMIDKTHTGTITTTEHQTEP